MAYFRGNGFSYELNTRTYIMGILNITADSFFDGGKWNTVENAVAHAKQMEADGADLLDIGAQSTRPGHTPLSAEEELAIIKRYMKPLRGSVQLPISVDTFYPSVAEYCLLNGAAIVNDVSGVFNPEMAAVVKKYNAGWIVMHTGGGDASHFADYPNGVVADVQGFFADMKAKCTEFGISSEQLCYDMGIGFGKNHEDNKALIQNIRALKARNDALLTALSCKRVIALETHADGDDRVYGTIAADTVAIAGGTDLIRVHHVKEAKLAALMADALLR